MKKGYGMPVEWAMVIVLGIAIAIVLFVILSGESKDIFDVLSNFVFNR